MHKYECFCYTANISTCVHFAAFELSSLLLHISPSDIDECAAESPCHSNGMCTNTPGSYTCACNDGYTGDGTTCTGMNISVIQLTFQLLFVLQLLNSLVYHSTFLHQILMNVLRSLLVIRMACVQTHLGPTPVPAMTGTLEMEELAQV